MLLSSFLCTDGLIYISIEFCIYCNTYMHAYFIRVECRFGFAQVVVFGVTTFSDPDDSMLPYYLYQMWNLHFHAFLPKLLPPVVTKPEPQLYSMFMYNYSTRWWWWWLSLWLCMITMIRHDWVGKEEDASMIQKRNEKETERGHAPKKEYAFCRLRKCVQQTHTNHHDINETHDMANPHKTHISTDSGTYI